MNYAKDYKNESPYVSVNTLIKPQKSRGLNAAPPVAAVQLQEKELESPLPEDPAREGGTSATDFAGDSREGASDGGPELTAQETASEAEPLTLANTSSEAGGQEAGAPESATPAAAAPEAGSPEEAKEETGGLENVPLEDVTADPSPAPAEDAALDKETEAVTPESSLEEAPEPAGEAQPKSKQAAKPIQTKTMTAAASGADETSEPGISAATLNSTHSGGQPLPEALGQRMGQAMGADFSEVRIHQDQQSAALSGQLNAKAFTHGADIYFNQGQYNPDTSSGQHLIAHELAHVEQQRAVPGLQTQLEVPEERDRYEQEADYAANQVVASPAPVQPARTHLTPVTRTGNSNSVQLKAEDQSSPNWIMEKVGGLIRNIPGYDVLTLIIGRDPITGQEVKRDGIAFAKAIVGLIPGGKAIFENLEKAGVITRAVAWFKEEFKKLDLSFNTIKSLFNQAVEAIFGKPKENEGFFSKLGRGLVNLGKALLSPVETFNKLKHIFLGPIGRILNFVGAAGMKLLEFVFEGALTLVGAPVNMIMGILNKGKEVLGKIIKDPIGFLKNLLGAVKNGLGNFVGNIVSHLQTGLVGWLFGALSGAGIILPDKFSLAGIFHVVAQILGVTWQAIKGLVVKRLGPIAEKVIGAVEKSIGFVVTLITKGPMALLEMAQEFLGELKTMFFDSLIEWVRNTIIVKAIQKLISMFNPVGAIIQAIITIYNTIQFFIERAKQIAAFVSAVFNSIAEIANGNLGKAVAAVENALAKGLPVAISFLASLIGLGGIAKKIQEIIKKVRKPIDKVIGKVVGFIVDKAKKIWATMTGAGKKKEESPKNQKEHDAQVEAGLAALDGEQRKIDKDKDSAITFDEAESVAKKVKQQYPVFKSITVVDGEDSWDYDYVASPGKVMKGFNKEKNDEEAEPVVVKATLSLNGRKYNDVNPTARKPRPDPGQPISGLTNVNNNTRKAHAEIGAMYQALNDGNKGGKGTLIVTGKEICGFCQIDVKKMAQKLALIELTVTDESGAYKFNGPKDFENKSDGGKNWEDARL